MPGSGKTALGAAQGGGGPVVGVLGAVETRLGDDPLGQKRTGPIQIEAGLIEGDGGHLPLGFKRPQGVVEIAAIDFEQHLSPSDPVAGLGGNGRQGAADAEGEGNLLRGQDRDGIAVGAFLPRGSDLFDPDRPGPGR